MICLNDCYIATARITIELIRDVGITFLIHFTALTVNIIHNRQFSWPMSIFFSALIQHSSAR